MVTSISGISEKNLVDTTLAFALLRNANLVNKFAPIDELMYIMMSFLGLDASFLEPDTRQLIQRNVDHFFANNRDTHFDFQRQDDDALMSFENLFIAFLEQFAATSYGDGTFGALLMIPLAMKYDVKWRKMVWSEHASVLRFITCTTQQFIGGSLDDYLYPIESDTDLLDSYVECLNTKVMRTDSVPYQIATHHLTHYKRNSTA